MIKTAMKKWGLSVITIVTSAIVILALLLLFNINTKKAVEAFIHNNMAEANHTAAISLNNNFQSFIDLLAQQAMIFGLLKNPSDDEIMSALTDFATQDRFKNAAIIAYDGTVYSSYRGITAVQPGEQQPNLFTDSTVVSQPRTFWDDTLVIDISTPVYIDGQKIGKLVATIGSDAIASMFNDSILQGDAALCLFARDGTVITRIAKRDSPLTASGNLFDFYSAAEVDFLSGTPQSLLDDFDANQSNWLEYRYLGESVCTFYEPVGINDWYLFIAATDATLIAQTANLERLALLLTFGILIVVVISTIIIMIQRVKEQERLAILKNTYSIAIRKTNDLFYETDIDNDLFIDHTEHVEKEIWKETPKNYHNALTQVADMCSPEYKQAFLDTFLPQNIKIKIKEGISSINFEYKIIPDEHTVRWLSATFVPIYDASTNSTKLICMENDITEQMLKKENLTKRASSDGLTGLYNKSTTMQYINSFLGDAGTDEKHALMIIDIDFFKSVNDNLGHAAGDAVLSEFGHGLSRIFRRNDIVGRIGGDEFIVLLKDYGAADLIANKADEIRCIIKKEHAAADAKGHSTKTSASIGIALYSQDGQTFEELYKNADIALYVSKKAGRDRYTLFHQTMKKE